MSFRTILTFILAVTINNSILAQDSRAVFDLVSPVDTAKYERDRTRREDILGRWRRSWFSTIAVHDDQPAKLDCWGSGAGLQYGGTYEFLDTGVLAIRDESEALWEWENPNKAVISVTYRGGTTERWILARVTASIVLVTRVRDNEEQHFALVEVLSRENAIVIEP